MTFYPDIGRIGSFLHQFVGRFNYTLITVYLKVHNVLNKLNQPTVPLNAHAENNFFPCFHEVVPQETESLKDVHKKCTQITPKHVILYICMGVVGLFSSFI